MMNSTFQTMTQKQAEEIATNWHYNGKYSFYDMDADQEDLEEFLDAEKRNESYFIVIKDKEVIGFYSFNQITEDTIDIGLGMKPDLTGNGYGLDFLKEGLEFAKSKYNPKEITLSVATFNQRAIRVYKKVGFKEAGTFVQVTNGSSFEFLKMVLLC